MGFDFDNDPLTVVRVLRGGKDTSSGTASSHGQLRDASKALGVH